MIRKANFEDAPAIHEISKVLGYEPVELSVAVDRIDAILRSPTDELFVFDSGEIKGWIHVFIANRVASAPFVEIGGLAVSSKTKEQFVYEHCVRS